jgi:hypothetical protein
MFRAFSILRIIGLPAFMRSLASLRHPLLPWILALLVFAAMEAALYIAYRPSLAERSDFIKFTAKRHYNLPFERWLIWEKFSHLEIQDPTIVHVGDSSGFYGLMPEVIEQYLGGHKVLNYSCCANQGFHGYLAALEYAVRKYPSLKYFVVNMAPIVHPQAGQWRGAGELPGMGLPIMGDDMERNFTAFTRHFYPPSNMFRWAVSRRIQRVAGPPVDAPHLRDVMVIHERHGYAIEFDRQTSAVYCEIAAPRMPDGRSYLDAFTREFVGLARRYGVTPVLHFHPSACPNESQQTSFDTELARVRAEYPELRVPQPVIDAWPDNFFSVAAHVQRGVAIEASRRFGRAMRGILRADGRLAPATTTELVEPRPATIKILQAGTKLICDYWKEYTNPTDLDLTPGFAARCDGKGSCVYPMGTDAREPVARDDCKPQYEVIYQCTGEPVRMLRQDDPTLFQDKFALNCDASAKLRTDPMAYGIQILDVGPVAREEKFEGRATLRAKARCDGLFSCDLDLPLYLFDNVKRGEPRPMVVEYFCDRDSRVRQSAPADQPYRFQLKCDAAVAASGH